MFELLTLREVIIKKMSEIRSVDLDYIRFIENLSKNPCKVVDRVSVKHNEETFIAIRKAYSTLQKESSMFYLKDGVESTESISELWYETKESIKMFFHDAGNCIMTKGKHGFYDSTIEHTGKVIEDPNILYVCKEQFAKEILKQIVNGLLYLKKCLSISHNDIKPGNIISNLITKEQFQLIQLSKIDSKWYQCAQDSDINSDKSLNLENLRLELIDLEHYQNIVNNTSSSGGTTRTYIPPECVNSVFCNGYAKDIWSLGCVMHIFLTGMHPIYHHGYSEFSYYIESLNSKIQSPNFKYHPFLSERPRNLIRKMLEPKAELRITLEDIINDPWLIS